MQEVAARERNSEYSSDSAVHNRLTPLTDSQTDSALVGGALLKDQQKLPISKINETLKKKLSNRKKI